MQHAVIQPFSPLSYIARCVGYSVQVCDDAQMFLLAVVFGLIHIPKHDAKKSAHHHMVSGVNCILSK